MNNKCRLCLNESPEIVEELIEGCDIMKKLAKSLSHYISLTKELPNKICRPCKDKVKDIYEFHQFINQNEIILQKKINVLCKQSEKLDKIKVYDDLYDENELIISKEYTNNDKLDILEIIVKTEVCNSKEKCEDNITFNSNNTNNKNCLNKINSEISTHRTCQTKIETNGNTSDNLSLKENKISITDVTNIDDPKKYMCLTCFELFPNQRELLRHYQTVELEKYCENNIEIDEKTEPVRYKSYVSEDGTLITYKCERCYKKYTQKTFIERHIKSHIEKRPFLCKLCGKTYQTASIIVAHGKMHAGEMYTCSYNCGYKSVHKHVVKDHEKRHRKEFKYKCETCGKGFQVRTSFEQHENIHKGIKPFACDICNMTFHLHKYLTTHRSNVHPQTSGRKPWLCKLCSLPCDSKNSLNLHLKEKHGITVKVSTLCDVCGKVVRDTRQLKLHQRSVHLNIKPYICSVCNKSFPKKFTLKVHEQIHTGKLYGCNMCDKKFSRQSSQQRHLQRFHLGSKLKCQKCEKVFTSKLKLSTHIKCCSKNINTALIT